MKKSTETGMLRKFEDEEKRPVQTKRSCLSKRNERAGGARVEGIGGRRTGLADSLAAAEVQGIDSCTSEQNDG